MLPYPLPLKCKIMADDIRENAMGGGTPKRLRGLDANGSSISPTLEEVMNAIGIYTYSFTLASNEEKDLGNLGYGMYFLTSTALGISAAFICSSYPDSFISDGGKGRYCDYTDGSKSIVFGRKELNGSFFIKNNQNEERDIRIKKISI